MKEGETAEQNLQDVAYAYKSAQMDGQAYQAYNALRIRLDTTPALESVREYLSGERLAFVQTETGETRTVIEKIGEPLVNQIGLQAVMNKLVALFNSQVVQGNLDEEMYASFIEEFDISFTRTFAINYVNWGVKPDNKQLIYDTIIELIMLFLTRPIKNLERESYADTVKHFETTNIGKENKMPFGIGGR